MAQSDEKSPPLACMRPGYPIRPWVLTGSGEQVLTVAVRQDSGNWVAVMADDPTLRATGATQEAAEEAVLQLLQERRPTPPTAARLTRTLAGLTVTLEWDEDTGQWMSFVPALDNLSTFGDTPDDAMEQTRDMLRGFLKSALEHGDSLPMDQAQAQRLLSAL